MSKKIINFAVVILTAITIIGLSSCKDEEVRYSCNPAIDAVIRQNLPRYENMTRSEWKNLPDSLKSAAFVAMTPELKKEFWRGKQEEILSARFFNDYEKEHISKLYDYFLGIDDFYTEKYRNDLKRVLKVEEYYKEWAIYGVDSLKWDIVDVILIAEDKEELTEDYIEHVKHNAPPFSNFETKKPDCTCSYNIGCGVFTGYCDKKVDCTGVVDCGIGSSFVCTGICDEPTTNGNSNNGNSGTPKEIDPKILEYLERLGQMSQRELLDVMFEQKMEAIKTDQVEKK